MDDEPRMQVLQRFGHLVDDKTNVHIFQYIFRYYIVQISLHELKDQINVLTIVCPQSIVKLNDIGVFRLFEDLDFAVGTLGVGGVLEGVEDFFEGVYFFSGFLLYFPDVAIRARAHFFNDIEAAKDVAFDVGGVGLRHDDVPLNISVIKFFIFIYKCAYSKYYFSYLQYQYGNHRPINQLCDIYSNQATSMMPNCAINIINYH